jgi:hypothetical protein
VNQGKFAIESAPILPEIEQVDFENEINNKINVIEDL